MPIVLLGHGHVLGERARDTGRDGLACGIERHDSIVTVTPALSVNQAKLLGEQHENTDAQRDDPVGPSLGLRSTRSVGTYTFEIFDLH